MAINDLLSSSTWKPARAVVDDVIINVELVWVPIRLIITQAGASRSSVCGQPASAAGFCRGTSSSIDNSNHWPLVSR